VILMLWDAAGIIRARRQRVTLSIASKVAWIIASLRFTSQLGDADIPFGALTARLHVRSLRHRHTAGQRTDMPFAEGSPARSRDEQ